MGQVVQIIGAWFIIYPLFVIVMWFFLKWSNLVKILISIPVILMAIFAISFGSFAFISASEGNKEAENVKRVSGICDAQCKEVPYPDDAVCFNKCTESNGIDFKRSYLPAATILPTQSR
jgi:hypothetical protein